MLRRGHELGTLRPDWRYPSANWVRETERLVELDARLPLLLKAKIQPANAGEWLEYAQLCRMKKLHSAAARLYIAAFAADPKLDLNVGQYYAAACSAALAGHGQGNDAGQLDEMQRAAWRKQALSWLRADLKAWKALLEGSPHTKDLVVKNPGTLANNAGLGWRA